MNTTSRLDQSFFALADPTRRELLRLLEAGPATVSALAARFKQSLPGISKHLRILSEAGLLTLKVSPTDRRAKTCELNAAGLDEAQRWMENSRAAWNKRFDALERMLERDSKRSKS